MHNIEGAADGGVEIADKVGCWGSEGKIKFRTMRARIDNPMTIARWPDAA